MPALMRSADFDANGGKIRTGASTLVYLGSENPTVIGLARCRSTATGRGHPVELARQRYH